MFRFILILTLVFMFSCKEKELKTKMIQEKIVEKKNQPKKIEEIKILTVSDKTLEIKEVSSSDELLELLEYNHLLDISDNVVDQLYLKHFPNDLKKMDVKTKKKIFFHSLIPMAIFTSNNIKRERKFLLEIIERYNLKKIDNSTLEELTENERELILGLSKKYKSKSVNELKKRIDIIPISLILSQSAIESAWGGSRFSKKGNNLFGIWAKKDGSEKSIGAKYKRKGAKRARVKAYNSLLESVEDYCYKINTVKSYRYLRKLRVNSKNSLILAKGLKNYSERKWAYVKDVQKLIRRNKLSKYDNLKFQE